MRVEMFLPRQCIAALFLLALPAIVQAQFTYVTNNDAITITGYTGPGGVVVIPDATNGYPVVGVADFAFENDSNVTSFSIPASVTNIGNEVFLGCADLTRISVDTNNPSYSSFGPVLCGGPLDDGLRETLIAYPEGLKNATYSIPGPGIDNIAPYAFASCTNLTSITISGDPEGDGVNTIGDYAFYGCTRLTNVVLSLVVTNIGQQAFAFCTNLTAANFQGNAPPDVGNAFYGDPNAIVYYLPETTGWGATFGGAPTVEETPPNDFSWQVINGSITITYYGGLYRAVAVPPYINGLAVTSIGPNAFNNSYGYSVTNVVIPDTVTSIGEEAFNECASLTSATIPNSLTSIGPYAFADCTSLSNVNIPDGVTNIGADAFADCTGLTGINIPGSVTSVGEYAFSDCTGLASITISNGVAGLGLGVFDYCFGLTNVTIPGSVTTIGQGAFWECTNLASVTISNGVTSIGPTAFEGCPGLTSVTIPASVTNIQLNDTVPYGLAPFYDCLNLTNISVDAANPAYSSLGGVLFDKAQATLVEYPAGLANSAYTISASVTSVGLWAFAGCVNLTSVTIPNSVTNVGFGAFYECTGLKSAYFLGNAPPDFGNAFYGDPTIIYYLPGTTGWGATFGGVPAMLWNPQAAAFTTVSGQFGFNITGPTNATIVVEACTNLANPVWLPVSTNTLSGSGTSTFSDPQSANYPNRYYRFSAP